MTHVTFDVPGAQLTSAVVLSLLDALGPISRTLAAVAIEKSNGSPDWVYVTDEDREALERGESFVYIDRVSVTLGELTLNWSRDEVQIESIDSSSRTVVDYEFNPDFGITPSVAISAYQDFPSVSVKVDAPASYVDEMTSIVRSILEVTIDPAVLEAPYVPPFSVFIGHGGDAQWEQVRDYIKRDGGYPVEAFESDARVGQATLEVVENMISSATVAVIIMTAADKLADGRMLARQNVVHEIGFAQGKLGVAQTIILLEDGAEEFTNIAGITQIRFRRGEIHRTAEGVLAALANRKRDYSEYGPYGGHPGGL